MEKDTLYEEMKERAIFNPVFKEKLMKAILPSTREKIKQDESNRELERMLDEQDEKYMIPSYLKGKNQTWDEFRKEEGLMPF